MSKLTPGLVRALRFLKTAQGKHRMRTSNSTNAYNIATAAAFSLEHRGFAEVIHVPVTRIEYEVEITEEGLAALEEMGG